MAYTLQWAAPFALKIAPSHGGIWTPSNRWFLGPNRVYNPNCFSIGSATFCWAQDCDRQTDWHTDHATLSVTIGRIYVRSTAMRPINCKETRTSAGLTVLATLTMPAMQVLMIGIASFSMSADFCMYSCTLPTLRSSNCCRLYMRK